MARNSITCVLSPPICLVSCQTTHAFPILMCFTLGGQGLGKTFCTESIWPSLLWAVAIIAITYIPDFCAKGPPAPSRRYRRQKKTLQSVVYPILAFLLGYCSSPNLLYRRPVSLWLGPPMSYMPTLFIQLATHVHPALLGSLGMVNDTLPRN